MRRILVDRSLFYRVTSWGCTLKARSVIKERGELLRAPEVGIGAKGFAINELRVWARDCDIDRLAAPR